MLSLFTVETLKLSTPKMSKEEIRISLRYKFYGAIHFMKDILSVIQKPFSQNILQFDYASLNSFGWKKYKNTAIFHFSESLNS